MRDDTQPLITQLRAAVGQRYVLTKPAKVAGYCRPYRGQAGMASCVVLPGTLLEWWRVLEACVSADVAILMQAANTSLTGGSTPNKLVERDTVIINTQRIAGIRVLPEGDQVVAYGGATLDALEKTLAEVSRAPHSVIGSSCLGASIIGGVCNNSGGGLVNRGPAYTELSLFAQVDAQGHLSLVNHLDIDLGESPEEMLTRLESGNYQIQDVHSSSRKASATDYQTAVRAVKEDSPARYNGDPDRLYESSGSSGKLAVFAVRIDSFDKRDGRTILVGADNPDLLTTLRNTVLTSPLELPISAEYMHQYVVQSASRYGRDTIRVIEWLGTSRLPLFFKIKRYCDALFERWGLAKWALTDRLLQGFGALTPNPIPKTLRAWVNAQQHIVVFNVYEDQGADFKALLEPLIQQGLRVHECNAEDGARMALIRYAAAGAAVRCAELNKNSIEDVLALDISLKRNDSQWCEVLPESIASRIAHTYYYGHFLCYVFHQDYLIKKGEDCEAIKQEMLQLLTARGAKYPAEHNVGTLYAASPTLVAHLKSLDPTNTFNPGVGQTSTCRHYGEQQSE